MKTNEPLERELLALENKYMQAIQMRDVKTAAQLTADPCLVTGAEGASQLDKKTMQDMMAKPTYELKDYKLSDVQFQSVAEGVAVIAYKLHQDVKKDGKDIELNTVNSSTWVQRNGSWVCAVHTEANAKK